MGVPGMATVNRQHDFYASYYASSKEINYPVEALKREAKRKFVYVYANSEEGA